MIQDNISSIQYLDADIEDTRYYIMIHQYNILMIQDIPSSIQYLDADIDAASP